MNIALKKDSYNQLINLISLNEVVIDFIGNSNLVTISFTPEELSLAIDPYLLLKIRRELNMEYTHWYHDHPLDFIKSINSESSETNIQEQIFLSKELNQEIINDFNKLKEDLNKIIINSFEENYNNVLEIEVDDDNVIINGKHYDFNLFEQVDSQNIEVKILSGEEYSNLRRKGNIQAYKLKYLSDDIKADNIVFTLLKNNKIIGATLMFPSCEHENFYASSATSILEDEQGNGYSQLLLDARIKFLKENNKGLQNSIYSHEGFAYLRPKTLELCNQYNIPLIENGLSNAIETIEEYIFYNQLKYKEALEDSRRYNRNDLYISSVGYVDLTENLLSKIQNFIKEDVYLKTREDFENLYTIYQELLPNEYFNLLEKKFNKK